MMKNGFLFKRNYTIQREDNDTLWIKSSRKKSGGIKLQNNIYLNPLPVKEKLDKDTYVLEDNRRIFFKKGIAYISSGSTPKN